ncbi:MAG: TIGR03086 family metal-binding protein [Mycobacteriales bacterium]
MHEVVSRFQAALNAFDAPLHVMSGSEWTAPTPCSAWDVRALVNHVVGEMCWVPPLVEGKTIADVGTSLDGDLLGDDPLAAWHHASNLAHEALDAPGAIDGTVHLSYGDESVRGYCEQLTADALVHGWDLARAVGADDTLPPELVAWASGWVAQVAPLLEGSGMFAAPVPVTDDADPQTALLAALGRAR